MFQKISVIIPCLWTDQKYVDMTFRCVSSLGNVGQVLVIADNATYAQNVNTGLRAATGEVLIISNNDIEFIDPHWLQHLLSPLETADISSIRTTDSDGWETQDYREEGAKFGSLWAMKRSVYETLGGLDESYGNYFEDLDYHRKAEAAGMKIVKNHAGLVEHIGKATFSQVDPDDTAFWKARELFISRWGEAKL